MDRHQCPRCGSYDVTGRKFGGMPGGGHLREFGCLACGLIEDRRSDAPDLREFIDRWYEPRSES
jgi:hypothetical protein